MTDIDNMTEAEIVLETIALAKMRLSCLGEKSCEHRKRKDRGIMKTMTDVEFIEATSKEVAFNEVEWNDAEWNDAEFAEITKAAVSPPQRNITMQNRGMVTPTEAIVVGRHLNADIGFAVIENRNITWPATAQECWPLLRELIELAYQRHVALIFQSMPPQVIAAYVKEIVAWGAMRDETVGVIADGPAGKFSHIEWL